MVEGVEFKGLGDQAILVTVQTWIGLDADATVSAGMLLERRLQKTQTSSCSDGSRA